MVPRGPAYATANSARERALPPPSVGPSEALGATLGGATCEQLDAKTAMPKSPQGASLESTFPLFRIITISLSAKVFDEPGRCGSLLFFLAPTSLSVRATPL